MALEERRMYTQKQSGQEARYHLAIEAANIGTFDWNLVTDEFVYSDRMAACFGYSDPKNITRSQFLSAIFEEDIPVREAAHRVATKTGKLSYDTRVVWPDKSLHWLRINGQVFYNDLQEPESMYGTVIDITEQQQHNIFQKRKLEEGTHFINRLDQELKRSEERLLMMIDEVEDYAIILLDVDGSILNWNRGAEKIKGYKEAEIIGKNFRLFYQKQDQEDRLPEKLISLAKSEGRAMHEGYRVRKDGTRFWGSIVITALHNRSGQVTSFLKVTRDLSDRKQAEDQLKRYTEELEIRNRELEQFAYVASHDLQEPLRKIQVFTGLLKKHFDDKEQAEKFFEKITGSAQRMSDLIESILKYSRLSPSQATKESVDMNKVLAAVKMDLELLIEEKNAVVSSSELPLIPGIESHLHQLMYNLISNSLKFTDESPLIEINANFFSGAERKDIFSFDSDMDYVELIFKDNGIGFESDEASKIFTIFMRLNGRRFSGSGIGLALCKRIVENHHGFIRAESEPEKGSTFFVYLPMKEGLAMVV